MQCQSVAIRGQGGLQPIPYLFLMSLRIKGLSKGVLVSAIQNDLVPTFYIDCCSNVIMSGWGDDNPDDEGREAARGSTKSVSRGADGGRGSHGSRSKRAAVLPDQSKGVVHGNRGRPSKHKAKEKTVKHIVELARGEYRGFNDHHLTEKLREEQNIELCREKIRQILRSHGIASPRKRRGLKHRSRRERRAAEGMMLQVDGSPHDWLEGRGPCLCLIGAIDDATGKVLGAFFEEAESSWAYFRLFSE